MAGARHGVGRGFALLLASPLLLVAGCDHAVDPVERADQATPPNISMKLDAYRAGLLDLDLRGARQDYLRQKIATARPDDDILVDAAQLESWAEPLDRAMAMDGTIPAVDAAAERFRDALQTLTAHVRSLTSYYRTRAYYADDLARGRREDPLVIAEYDQAIAALAPLQTALAQASDRADAALLRRLQAEGDMVGYYDVALAGRARALRVVAADPGLANDAARVTRADTIIAEVTALLDKAKAARAAAAAQAAKAPKNADDSAVASGLRPDDNVLPAT